MTVKDYIIEDFSPFEIKPSDADFYRLKKNGVNIDDDIDSVDSRIVLEFELWLVRKYKDNVIKSITEQGFSASWQDNRVYSFYSLLCEELGVPKEGQSRITDASDLW